MEYIFADRMGKVQASAIREILKFTSEPGVISLAAGNPAPEAFPIDAVRQITEKILTENPILSLQYSITEGYPKLRETLKTYLTKKGLGQDFDDLITTSGAQQAIDLATRIFCQKGDTILCEAPTFVGSLNGFKASEANVVGIPMEEDGISIEALEKALQTNKNVKFLYVIPNFQNPSGITMSLAKRKSVYELAKKYGIMILEDNPYGELRFSGEDIPCIKSLDTDGLVIYCGSFSKVLSPGLRVGYVLAPAPVIGKMVVLKQTNDVHTGIMAQIICEQFMNEYDFEAHIASLRKIYRKKAQLMLDCFEPYFDPAVTHTVPDGGLFIWCTLPDHINMMSFCQRAVQEYKVAVVPGSAFMVRESDPTQSFRINFSTPTDEQILRGMELLGKLTKA